MTSCFQSSRRVPASLMGLVAVFLLVVAAPAGAATRVAVAGVTCQAYSNSMADALERNHVRLFNPATSGQDIWIVCSIPRIGSNYTVAGGEPTGWVEAFFDATSAVGAQISCAVREYAWTTTAIPGAPGDVLNAVALTLNRTTTVPGVRDVSYALVTDYDGSDENFYTVTCRLPPGTGMNTINMYQQ